MIVVTRNGETTVITGWRAWLIGTLAVVVATAVLACVAVLALGVTLTMALIALLVVPVAIGVALLASLFRPADRR